MGIGYVSTVPEEESSRDRLAAEVSNRARSGGCTVAVAESLTGGMISTALAAAEAAGEWFRGSVVAYSSEVKHDVLRVPDGPVVSAEAAETMAGEVRRLLRADIAVAVTGAGGPTSQDGQPPGTAFIAVADGTGARVMHRHFEGAPAEVCAVCAVSALQALVDRLRETTEGG
jgi:nicotinamide-nucleotide amidase